MYYIAQYCKNVARLYKKNVECGPRVKKVAHPWPRVWPLYFSFWKKLKQFYERYYYILIDFE
jgi:hypothetical protein